MILTIYIALNPLRSNPRKKAFYPKQWRAEGGDERGDGPGHPKQGGNQRVKLQNLKAVTR